ncbi:MAG: TonB-dependent receptor [Bacteroidales bacterium]|nr:TonB-dependent receptor [Bacteroidales bacterium]
MHKIVKTLVLLLLLVCIPLTSLGQERKITGRWQNTPLRTVLQDLEKQSGFTFAYRSAEIDLDRKVTEEAKGEDILALLSRMLAPQQLTARIEDKHIVLLRAKPEEQKKNDVPAAPKRTFSGTVVSTTDRTPLAGVTVYVKDTSNGTLTDLDGRYTLTVPGDTKEITFSMLGYLDKVVKTSENDNYFRMVFLDESSTALSEAVVVAFGTTQKRESIVTSVESINPEQLKSLHTPTLSQSFAGNLAGVISTQSSGEPGSDGANFWIRGISTFGPNSKPLYILDGIEVGVGVLDGISPESIESFAVLKDAAATALYGSRGANGVMIITTKSGRTSDKMSINVHFNSTVNTFTKVAEIADGLTYMQNYNEALRTRGGGDYYLPDKIEAAKAGVNSYEYPMVNWYDMIFRNYATAQSADVNIRGGGNRVNYFLSAMFSNQNGMIKNSPEVSFDTGLSARKFSFQSNVTAKLTNSTTASIKMTSILFYKDMPYYSTQHYFAAALYANPVNVSPTYPNSWLPDADYVVFGGTDEWDGTISWTNPYMDLSEGYRKQFTENTTTSVRLDQNLDFITPGLKLWGQASFYAYTAATLSFNKAPWLYRLQGIDSDPVSGEKTYHLSQLGSEGSKYITSGTSSSGYRELNLQTNLEYSRTFGPHAVNAVLLYHQKEHVDNQASSYNARLPRREQGFAGRLSYTLLDRYVLEGNFGYNGSENFMRGHRWGFFPSMAAGWIVSGEPFWDNLRSTVDLLKIRYSYGLSGNDYLSSRFPYISSVAMNVNSGFMQGAGSDGFYSERGNVVNLWGNEDATWEVSRKHDIGLELGIKQRFKFILDLFDENRTGIFMARQVLPASSGLAGVSPMGNLGAVHNRGLDMSAEYKRIFNPDFSISARATFTYAHNEITDYDEPEIQPYPYQSKIGQSVHAPYGLIALGLFKDQEDIDNSPKQTFSTNYKPGDIKYKDMNDDNVIDDNDATYIGLPTVPEINYGFGATMKYKSFDFSFFFNGRDRVSILMSDAVHPFVNKTHRGLNMFKWVADNHWSEDNPDPNAIYPRLDWEYNPNNIPASSFWLRDGKFLRLKNVELGWTWKEKLRIYCTGTNLFVLSPFKLWDPELANGAGVSYPLTKSVQLGLQMFF